MDDIELINNVIKDLGFLSPLKDSQIECLQHAIQRNDVMAILPTGYGKSLIFQAAPFVLKKKYGLEKSVCIILTPLNSIMVDQINSLNKLGIPACWLDFTCMTGQTIAADSDNSSDEVEGSNPRPVVNVPLEDIAAGKYSLVYAHPEALMSTASGEALLNKLQKGGVVSCIAIDEAHMILEW